MAAFHWGDGLTRQRLARLARAYIGAMPRPYPVTVEIEGRRHHGQWTLKQCGKLCVGGGVYGARVVDLGPDRPENAAAAVLAELVLAWKEREFGSPKEPRQTGPIDKPFPLTVIVKRRPWNGTWRLLGGQVFVYSAYGSDVAAVKRSTPERVAERLLKALVSEWLERPDETDADDQHP